MNTMNHMPRVIVYCLCSTSLLWTFGAHAPAAEREPDNAALLYYQAFLLCPDIDSRPQQVMMALRRDPGGGIADLRKYAQDHQHVIRLLEAGSNVPHCNMAVPWLQRHVL